MLLLSRPSYVDHELIGREGNRAGIMDERALKFRVGVVVVAAAIITVILITLLGAWPNPFKARYTVYIVFPEAPGVTVDTPVRKSGIQIGRVSNVELRDEGGVLLTLKVDAKYRLKMNEVCRISTGSLVTGDAVLEFVRTNAPELAADPISDREYLTNGVVAANPIDVLTGLEGQIGSAIGSIESAGAEVSTLARSMNSLVGSNRDQLQQIIRKTDIALDSFNNAMASFQEILGDPNLKAGLRQSLEDLPKLFADARDTLKQTRETLNGFGRVSARAERNLANLEDFTAPLGERGEQISEGLANTAQNVDELLGNLVQLSRAINSREGTVGSLIHDRELYDRLNRAAKQLEELAQKVQPILSDARVFTDKIARDPRQLGVKGALDRKPNGAGVKWPTHR